MLVGGRMKHRVGPVGLEDPVHPLPIAHVGDDRYRREVGKPFAQLGEHVEDRVFPVAEQQDLRGIEPGELPAELAADRSAGAGDQNRLAGREHSHLVEVGLNRLATKQVLDFDVPERADRYPAGEDVVHAGDGAGLRAGLDRDLHDLPYHPAWRSWHGDDDLVYIILQHYVLYCGQWAEDRQVAHPLTVFGSVVVHKCDGVESELRMPEQLLDYHFPCRPCPSDKRAPSVPEPLPLTPLARRPNGQARRRRNRCGEQAIHEEHGQRDPHDGKPQPGEHPDPQYKADEPRRCRGRNKPLELHHTRVAPEPPVHPDGPEDIEFDREGNEHEHQCGTILVGSPIEALETESEGDDGRSTEKKNVRSEKVSVADVGARRQEGFRYHVVGV